MEGVVVKGTEDKGEAVALSPVIVDELVRPVEGGEKAPAEAGQVVLRLGDFIKRIPRDLLKSSELDLDRTLRFDLVDLADCLAEGISTVPLALLVQAIPDIFIDNVRDQQLAEIRFPWTRLLETIKDPLAAKDGNDGASILQSLLRHCANGDESPVPAGGDDLNRTHGSNEATPSERRESGRTNVWFSRKKGAKGEGTIGWSRGPARKSEPGSLATGPTGGDANQAKGDAPTISQDREPQNDPSEGALVKLPATSEPAARCKVSPIAQAVRIAELEKQLKELSARYLGEIATLRAEISRRASPVSEEAESELSQVCRELAELQSEYQWVLEESGRALDEAVARVAAEHDGRIREMEAAIRERDARLAGMTTEHNAAVQKLREEFEGKMREMKPEMAPSEPRNADQKSEHQQALEESARVREEAVARIAAERDGLLGEKEATAKEHEARLAEMTRKREAAVQVLRDEFEGEVRELRRSTASSASQIFDLKSEHQRVLEESARARDEEVARIGAERDRLLQEKESAAKEHEARLSGISTELESLRADSNARREDADRLLESLQREYLEASAGTQRELEQLQAEHRQTLGDLTVLRTQLAQHRGAFEEQAARLRKADAEKAEAIARLEAEHEWDIGQIVLEMQKNLSALHPANPQRA